MPDGLTAETYDTMVSVLEGTKKIAMLTGNKNVSTDALPDDRKRQHIRGKQWRGNNGNKPQSNGGPSNGNGNRNGNINNAKS